VVTAFAFASKLTNSSLPKRPGASASTPAALNVPPVKTQQPQQYWEPHQRQGYESYGPDPDMHRDISVGLHRSVDASDDRYDKHRDKPRPRNCRNDPERTFNMVK
jgi:hypothetical protein